MGDGRFDHGNCDVAESDACLEEASDFLLHFRIRDESSSLESEVGRSVDYVIDDLRVVAECCSDLGEEVQHLLEIFSEVDLFEEGTKQIENCFGFCCFHVVFI